ncbi:predicted protein [Nematostella vectensis]|uniref:Uncharacterized protein n=1 Tax=Nematostella vectensis TaxID=45351 RepID=A7SAV0_NEMVE|nr:predicted protein [Nematostella vectensis]|eukprot:XP_001631252.1 predicted protein [Nematostella vectensis]
MEVCIDHMRDRHVLCSWIIEVCIDHMVRVNCFQPRDRHVPCSWIIEVCIDHMATNKHDVWGLSGVFGSILFFFFLQDMTIFWFSKLVFVKNIKSAYAHFSEDLKLSADNSSIIASRVLCYMKSSSSSTFQKDAMLILREDLSAGSDLPVYATSQAFIYLEQYVVIQSEVIRNLAIAGGTVFVITWLFLLSLTASIIIFFSFGAQFF